MPAEYNASVTMVPLEPVGDEPPAGEGPLGPARRRRGWWLVVAAVVILGAAAVVVSLLTGTDPLEDGAGDEAIPEQDETAEAPDASPPEDQRQRDEASTDLDTPSEASADAAGDESAVGDADPEAQRLFGEPEQPISGVEPYIPSRVRPNELGPPAEVCLGTLPAYRIQLPLRFASSKPENIEQLTWSPDCRRVVFRVGAALWLADGDGTGDMPFLTAQHWLSAPAWSPDGEWIAFSQGAIVDGERAGHIFVVKPDALGLAQVTQGVVLDQNPAWSPDGESLVFSRRVRVVDSEGAAEFDELIVEVDLAAGVEQVLLRGVEPGVSSSWSPDRELLAYGSGPTLMVWRPGEDAGTILLAEVTGQGAAWSPDGSRVAAFRHWHGGRTEIVISDLPGQYPGDQHMIALTGFVQISPAMARTLQWSANGQRLFFFHSDSPTSHWAYSIEVPPPTRSAAYWEMLEVVETVVQQAGYGSAAVQHSVDVEAEFSVRGQRGQTTVEVWIAFDRAEPRGVYDAIENPHSELAGIRRSPDRMGVWFTCNDLYGEVLAESPQTADALAAALISAACPTT